MSASRSPLSAYRDLIASWITDGLNNLEIVKMLSDGGVSTSEASIRRFISKNTELSEMRKHQGKSDVAAKKSAIDIASRYVDGKHTREDELAVENDVLKSEIRRAQSIIKQFQSKDSIDARVVNVIRDAATTIKYDRPLSKHKPRPKKHGKEYEWALLVSDAHGGETVNPEEALGIQYNWDICVRRIEEMRNQVLENLHDRGSNYRVRKLHVPIMGDMLSGEIHEELTISNEFVIAEQMSRMSHVLYNLLCDLSEHFDEIDAFVLPGNHPRTKKTPSYKQKFNNWEFAMGHMIKGMVEAAQIDNIKVDVPKSMIHVHQIGPSRIAFMHGDGVKSASFAGIPFYGLRSQREAIQALMSLVGQERVDQYIIGHLHQHVYWQGECDVMINGSIKGGDEYIIGTRMTATPPRQLLLEYHPRHGFRSQTNLDLAHIK